MKLRGRLAYHLSLRTRATVLRLWARAIERMPYLRIEEGTGVTDLFQRTVQYVRGVFLETIDAISDRSTRELGKGLTETPGTSETLARDATLAKGETPVASEQLRRAATKPLTEAAPVGDSLAKGVVRPLATDPVTAFTEQRSNALTRPLFDPIAPGDTATRTWGYVRHFIEGGLYAEPGYFADDYVAKDLEPVDQFYFTAGKALSEPLAPTDLFARTHAGVRGFTESLSSADARTRLLNKPVSETIAASEGISLSLFKPIIEDARYAEDGYFADNYVTAGLVPADAITVTLNP